MPATPSLAKLALEDGTVFTGRHFGFHGTTEGEVVFNTSMTGYQEILTDPSYNGQIVTMTYPLIGNYGINREDVESKKPHVAGFIIKELAPAYSNYRADMSLDEYLKQNNIVGDRGHRHAGARPQVADQRRDERRALDRRFSTMRNLSNEQRRCGICPAPTGSKPSSPRRVMTGMKTRATGVWAKSNDGDGLHVVALDCGAKQNILRHLIERGVKVTVLPPDTTAEEILKHKPDGLFVSNGPGDPAALDYAVNLLKQTVGKVPIFGICLGHQLLGRAFGAYDLQAQIRSSRRQSTGQKPRHRPGRNHQPESRLRGRKNIARSKVGGVVTHVNLNDNTVEGFRHKTLPVFSVQYHPEASPGPHDAAYLFDAFVEMMKTKKPPTAQRLRELQSLRG